MSTIKLDLEYYTRNSNFICTKSIAKNDYCDKSFKSRKNLLIHYIKNHYEDIKNG